MDVIVIILSLLFLMFVAYKGFSVILFAPVAALLAVVLINPGLGPVFFSGIFMEKMVGFIKLYFPVFLLGAIFGKIIEMAGFARSITRSVIAWVGGDRAILATVIVGAILTYGGISLFVVAFALYPFAAELFRAADIPKRLIPGSIALGAFTFTMDAFPGSPQIQNIIPTAFFHTDTWAAPWLGTIGGLFVFITGMWYMERRRKKARLAGEGYGTGHINEPKYHGEEKLPPVLIALLPLLLVAVCNKIFIEIISRQYANKFDFGAIGVKDVVALDTSKLTAIWAVEGALLIGIMAVLALAFKKIRLNFNTGINLSIGGALLAGMNTASEYGFGAVIAALPGFAKINTALSDAVKDPLINEAITTTTLAGITGSASGGMSIALATMSPTYLLQAKQYGIEPEVLHRVASMASGGMDTLPHNGAVITLLAITGLTHKQSYIDIFAMTIIKTMAVFIVIGLYYLFGIK
jgi:H+/gluconate symporter-like permease